MLGRGIGLGGEGAVWKCARFSAECSTLKSMADDAITLYRPVGQAEFELIRVSGFKKFPPRLPHQPIFLSSA